MRARYPSTTIGRAALLFCLLLSLAAGAARAAETVKLGVLRWDNWNSGNPYDQVLSDPSLVARVPFYAQRQPDGQLDYPGDTPAALDADVHYAKAGGIDYFLFGYYLESASWGRKIENAQRLNTALRSYLALKDRLGVKFAYNFNWSFPMSDLPKVSAAVADAVKNPDYVRTDKGAAPVFFLLNSTAPWIKGLGGDDAARQALQTLRSDVKAATGRDLYLVALIFFFDKNEPAARALGFDAVSTYAGAQGASNRTIPYAKCADGARRQWANEAARPGALPLLPTVTMGWDYRPALRDAHERQTRNPNPDVCAPAADAEWATQVRAAIRTAAEPRNAGFHSVVFYAWNEFAEGGWMEPTVGEGVRRLKVIAEAAGRAPVLAPFTMKWPTPVQAGACKISDKGEPAASAPASCQAAADAMTKPWPCPPRMRVADDRLIPGDDAIWRERSCAPQ